MRPLMLIAAGTAFAAVASFFAPEHAWIEAVSESFVPYVAVPLLAGWAAHRLRIAPVALLGAGATVAMVMAFYLARPLLDGSHGIQWSDLAYWSLVGAVPGALLAGCAWRLRPHVATTERRWAVGAWLVLAVLPVIYFVYIGWGRITVAANSENVTIGYSTTDVLVASMVLATFHGGAVLSAASAGPAPNRQVDTATVAG